MLLRVKSRLIADLERKLTPPSILPSGRTRKVITPFGRFLTDRLDQLGIKQREFADHIAHVHPSLVTRWKNGESQPTSDDIKAITEAVLDSAHFPHFPDGAAFLEPDQVYELLTLYIEMLGVQPEKAERKALVVSRAKQLEADSRLAVHEADSVWFKFLTNQYQTLLSLVGGVLTPRPAHAPQDQRQTSEVNVAAEFDLPAAGENFLTSMLHQAKRVGPYYTRRPPSTVGMWRLAIYTPTRSLDYLRIKWDDGLGDDSRTHNRYYIGPNQKRQKREAGMPGRVYLSGLPFHCSSNITEHPWFYDCYGGVRTADELDYSSLIQFPIFVPEPTDVTKRIMFGVLSVDSLPYAFNEHDYGLLQPLADLCALCIYITHLDHLTQEPPDMRR